MIGEHTFPTKNLGLILEKIGCPGELLSSGMYIIRTALKVSYAFIYICICITMYVRG